VLEPLERTQCSGDYLVRRLGIEPRDEGDAACVVLEGRVVEPCLPPVM
jgi:hypothetical protein